MFLCFAEFHNALSVIIQSVDLMSIIMLSVVMLLLNFIMPQYYYNLVMLSIIK